MFVKKNSINQPKKHSHLGKLTTVALASTSVIFNTLPAQALTFNFTYEPGTSSSYKQAFEFAGRYWGDYLSDDATINIHVGFASASKLPKGMLAGSTPAFINDVSYSSFLNAINNDRTSQFDNIAASNLASGTQWQSVFQNQQKQTTTLSSDQISLTRANAKALNLVDKYSTSLDGVILVNKLDFTGYDWDNSDYSRSSVCCNDFDLYSVAVHELAHIMGFVSSIDGINSKTYNNLDARKRLFTPFDLFRYSDYGKSQGVADLSNGNASYFSIDKGLTNLGYLSTGKDTTIQGDGFQGSHWKNYSNTSIGVMAPTLKVGAVREVDERDLQVLDVLGWNRKSRSVSDLSLNWDALLAALGSWNKEVKRNADISNMINQNRWGGGSSGGTFSLTQDLADYLAQEGIFQEGTLWETLPEQNFASVPEPGANLGLLGLGLLALRSLKKRLVKSQP